MVNKSHFRRWLRLSSPLLLHIAAGALCVLIYLHLDHLYKVESIRRSADSVRVSLLEIESGQRGFLLTGNIAYLDNYRYNRAILRLRLEVLCRQIPNTEANKHLCSELATLIDKKLAEMEDTVQLARANKILDALTIVRTDRGFQYTRAIDDRLDHIRIEPGTPMESCLAE